MSQFSEALLERISHLPESPGVYLWKDASGAVLYVGKAKRLRSRVRSYVAADHVDMAIDALGLLGGGAHTPEEFADLRTFRIQAQRLAVLLARLSRKT